MLAVATVQTGGEIQSVEKTFDMIVEEWLQFLSEKSSKRKRVAKPRTIKSYRYALKVFKSWLDSEGVEIGQASEDTITAWTKAMDKAKNSRGQLWSASTKNLYLTAVRNFYKWLSDVSKGSIANITAGFGGWECSKEHKRGTLNVEEMKDLINIVEPVAEQKIANEKAKLEAAQKEAKEKGRNFNFAGLIKRYEKNIRLQALRDKAILAGLMIGGLRTIEISRLRVADLKRVGGVCYLNVLGKGKSDYELVKISYDAWKIIRKWLEAREAVDIVKNTSPLFCSISNNSFGEEISSLSVSRLVKEYLRAAGLKEKKYESDDGETETVKPIVAHSLRASMATQSLLNGAPLESVKQQLRHSNIQTTFIYLEEAKKALNPCSDIISGAIFC